MEKPTASAILGVFLEVLVIIGAALLAFIAAIFSLAKKG